MKKERVVLVIGTFHPITNAHLHMGEIAKEIYPEADVVYVPSNAKFMKKWKKNIDFLNDSERMFLLREVASANGFLVSSIELQGKVDGTTIQTVEYFKTKYEKVAICLGMDKMAEVHKWCEAEKLFRENEFIVFTRNEECLDDIESDFVKKHRSHIKEVPLERKYQGVSSTKVREAFKQGRLDDVKHTIPIACYNYLVWKKSKDIAIY